MKRPELAEDARFKTNRDRLKNNLALREIIESWMQSFPDRDAAIALLDAERVPCAPVYKLAESMAHPHLRGRKTVRRVRDGALGEFDIPGMPVKFSAWPDRTEVKASLMGADNAAIVTELAGLSAADADELARAGVLIAASPPSRS